MANDIDIKIASGIMHGDGIDETGTWAGTEGLGEKACWRKGGVGCGID